MKKIALLLSTLVAGFVAQAQIPITGSALTYTQDFNTLLNTGTANSLSITGWSIFKVGGSVASQTTYTATNGSNNAGGAHGVGAAGSTERALGSLGSSSASPVYYGAKFVNNTGVSINSVQITYKQEQWRSGDTVAANTDSTQFYYSLNATDVSDTSATAVWTEVPALLMKSLSTVAPSQTGIGLNGDSLFSVKNATITLTVPASANLVIRWKDMNSSGNDDLNAVDSLTMVFNTGTPPAPSFRPNVTTVSPANNATNVAVNSNLQITFDRNVTGQAAGNIRIKNVTDQTTVTKAGNSADVTIAGKTVTIANAGLAIGKSYYVTFDFTAFDTASYKSYGIYDSVSWRFATVPPPNYRPAITPVSPADNATSVSVATTVLKMAFSRKVTKGTNGNITIKNETDQTVQTKAVSSADVTLSAAGDTAMIANVTLLTGKSYHVLVDSVAFDTAGYKVVAITDTTRWNFSTQGPLLTVPMIDESFEASCPSQLPAGWLQYSVEGAQTWRCNNTSSNFGLVMNGGGTAGSTLNEDWLITPRINPAGQINMMLAFKAKYRFAGPVMEVKYSTNYSGTGDPNLATWADFAGIAFSAADSNAWNTKTAAVSNAAPLFIAFKYTSTQSAPISNAREWSVDSVVVKGQPNSVPTINSNGNSLPVQVLGTATSNRVMIGFDLQQEAGVQVTIYDLAGRAVYAESFSGAKGNNKLLLAPQALQSGMYIIRVSNGTQRGIARTFIN